MVQNALSPAFEMPKLSAKTPRRTRVVAGSPAVVSMYSDLYEIHESSAIGMVTGSCTA